MQSFPKVKLGHRRCTSLIQRSGRKRPRCLLGSAQRDRLPCDDGPARPRDNNHENLAMTKVKDLGTMSSLNSVKIYSVFMYSLRI
jgi:hypothetical protein